MKLQVRRATPEDVGTVVDILAEAAKWLASRGICQWPEHGFPASDVAERIKREEMHLVYLAGEPVATIAIDWADSYFWAFTDDDAVYVHRLAVRRQWAGQQIGERLLDWAADQAIAAGRTWVRLDCVADNKGLCQYYLDRGWTHVRDLTDEIGTESMFQRRAHPAKACATSRSASGAIAHAVETRCLRGSPPIMSPQSAERGPPTMRSTEPCGHVDLRRPAGPRSQRHAEVGC